MDRRWRVGVVLAGLAVLASGCGQAGTSDRPATSGSPSAVPSIVAGSPSVSPAPSASAAAAVGPAPRVRILGDEPVLRGKGGPDGHLYVLPGAAIEHEGVVHVFLVWFAEEPGTQIVTHAFSADGRTWTVDPKPAYTDLDLGLGPPGPIPADVMVRPDGTWVLYGWGEPVASARTFVSWRATAPGPDGPWSAQRILEPGGSSAWDNRSVAVTSVLETPGGFELYYEGASRLAGSKSRIGRATSDDGIAWTRTSPPGSDPGGGPVLEPGQCADTSTNTVTMPNVTTTPEGRLMLFTGFRANLAVVGAASSADGIGWTCAGTDPVVTRDDLPGSEGIHTVELFERTSGPALLVESLGDRTSDLWLAELDLP
jgi:hypothetical protein